MNPKQDYGSTHWIQYDFGAVRTLSKTWVWNTNDPVKLNQGFNQVKIDYSIDGEEWTHWGEMNFPQAQGEAVYSGFPGPDLMNIQAQYVLLTAMSNHGDPNCYGIAEIKFNLLPEYIIGDPPTTDCETIEEFFVETSATEAYIFWEFESEEEEVVFFFEYRVVGTDEWIELEIEENEIFLEELEPATNYEFIVGVACGEEAEFSEPGYFSTLEEGEMGCAAVEEIWVEELSSNEALIEWEGFENVENYLILFGLENDAEQDFLETDEARIFLEDLTPMSSYIIQVGIDCEEEVLWSEEFFFYTHGGGGINDVLEADAPLNDFREPLLYPNPNDGKFTLEYFSQQNSALEYTILNAQGKLIRRGSVQLSGGTNQLALDLSAFPDGVYLINTSEINDQINRLYAKKIIKM